MKVQHATLGGTITNRDTNSIGKQVLRLLKDFQLNGCSKKILKFPKSRMEVSIIVNNAGAVFNMMINGEILSINLCCFDERGHEDMIELVGDTIKSLPISYAGKETYLSLLGDRFLYSILMPDSIKYLEEIIICGEVVFYIYYSLHLARRNCKVPSALAT